MPDYLRAFILSVLIIVVAEAAVMLQFGAFLAGLSPGLAAAADALMLGAVCTPVLWLLVGRPLASVQAGKAAHEASRESQAARLEAEREKAVALERLKRTLDQSVGALAQMIDKRDPYTAGHQARVALIAEHLARDLGLSGEEVENIRLGALMHDIGKIGVPSEILTKPGKLIPQEMALVRMHPGLGGEVVGQIDFDPAVIRVVTQHHERLDGSGYPLGLEGDQIAREARVVAVADVLEAITSHRPYRPAMGLDMAIEELRRQRGTTLDREVVDAALRLLQGTQPVPGLEGVRPVTAPLPA